MVQRGDGSLEDFKARLPLGEIVARHVRLTRRGRELVGLCPFHQEKTPSFTVVEDKGFYHCFGCGAHGTAVDFVMNLEGVGFSEAISRLAEMTGIPPPARSAPSEPPPDPGLIEACAAALRYFRRALAAPDAAPARAYLEKRGIRPETVRRFELGYAPPGREGLKRALIAEGFREALLLEAGLVARRGETGETFDRFRHRLVFPIHDGRGRVVGFGGRALGEARAKYLNSPETPVFRKGRLLFNLHRAAPAARRSGELFVVEGYTDVLALAQLDALQAVAPLGTALTPDQLRLLWRLVDEPVLCFDGDVAGRRAAWRAALRALPLLAPGKSLQFALLPAGEDPDSLARGRGAAALELLRRDPRPLVDLLWQCELEANPPTTPERRAALGRRIRGLLREIADPAVREPYAEEWYARLRALGPSGPPRAGGRAPTVARPLDRRRIEEEMRAFERELQIRLLLPVLETPALLVEQEEAFAAIELSDSECERLRQEILCWYADAQSLDAVDLRNHLSKYGFDGLIEEMVAGDPRPRIAASADEDLLADWRAVLARLVRIAAQRREARMIDETLRSREGELTAARLAGLDRLLNPVPEDDPDRGDRGPLPPRK